MKFIKRIFTVGLLTAQMSIQLAQGKEIPTNLLTSTNAEQAGSLMYKHFNSALCREYKLFDFLGFYNANQDLITALPKVGLQALQDLLSQQGINTQELIAPVAKAANPAEQGPKVALVAKIFQNLHRFANSMTFLCAYNSAHRG